MLIAKEILKGKNMKKTIVLFSLLLALPCLLYAQTAARIELLLETGAVNYGQAAHFALEAAGVLSGASEAEAFAYAAERGWLPKGAAAQEQARLDGFALLAMEAFGIRGGIMFSLFKTPHYAYRELVYQDIIQGRAAPNMAVSGEELLFLINRVLAVHGDQP